ncbi:hypothetical protein [Burkholderia lata]|uniref:hypothetical protein n=1 Tax=Burkholderia lata (strain ATCC 17760 / DSM 23089 / LMG 22485 / NCIMB 9086 / R18194 / 383) TaxID=482957 RepID=UPI0014544619|nr:hypothetical protein [Burkholderia lata]VWB77804.1 hypothetical protein BLA15816_03709 [Burkholderia lata]
MTESNHDLPNEWPKHLADDAKVSPIEAVPPIGTPLLDFTAMSPSTFEQFCWWLLRKNRALVGCKRLGGNGTPQDGIDLFAFDEQQPDKLHVFECKAWKDFTPANLTKAVDAFLGGCWAESTITFTIILAQQDIGAALGRRWQTERQRLKQAGIEGEIWTAHSLTLMIQAYPDILSKFFPWPSVELYANQWMQRVSFYELVSKAFFDPRERVASWARELSMRPGENNFQDPNKNYSAEDIESDHCHRKNVPSSDGAGKLPLIIDGEYRQVNQHGGGWHFKGPWFSMSVILPGQRFTHASAAITFNRPDLNGMTLTVDHKWLLKRFLFEKESPLTSQYRGFVVGVMHGNHQQYLIDLPNCRMFLQEDGVQEIAGVADLLTDAMRRSLCMLERAWSAVDFPFVMRSGKKVALAAIDANVWSEIGWFAEEHDVSKGNTEWHMFDGDRQVLKPFHDKDNENFDAGYHGVFYAAEIDGLSYGREVILMWQPNGMQPDGEFSPRGWWSCEFAFRWLSEVLLPEVKRHVYRRYFNTRWKRLFNLKRANELAVRLDASFVVRDVRQPPLIRDGKWSVGIVQSAQELQRFFHGAGTPEPYIRQNEIEALYEAVALVAKGNRGYVGYAKSKLGLRDNPEGHAALIDAIHEHIREKRVVSNCLVVDNVFRAMLEMLDNSEAWLSDSDQERVRRCIAPFARIYDDATLVDRHTKWV